MRYVDQMAPFITALFSRRYSRTTRMQSDRKNRHAPRGSIHSRPPLSTPTRNDNEAITPTTNSYAQAAAVNPVARLLERANSQAWNPTARAKAATSSEKFSQRKGSPMARSTITDAAP